MGSQRTTFAKMQREKEKKAKAAAKRAARIDRAERSADESSQPPAGKRETASAEDLMNAMSQLHKQYDDGKIKLDDFDEQRAELQERIAAAAGV